MSIYRIVRQTNYIAAEEAGNQAKEYFNRLLRMIPGDVVAAYLTVRGFWLTSQSQPTERLAEQVTQWWMPIIGLLITVFLRIIGSSKKIGDIKHIQWPTVIISSLAFVIWLLNIQTSIFGTTIDGRIGASLLVVFTVVAPFIYKGDSE